MACLFKTGKYACYRDAATGSIRVWRSWSVTTTNKKTAEKTTTQHHENYLLSEWNPTTDAGVVAKKKITEEMNQMFSLCAR